VKKEDREGKMTWAAAKVKFCFFFFCEEKGDGKYQTWCLKEDWVRKGLTVAERRDNIGLKEWRKFAYVRRRDDSGFGDINREQKRKQ
jgi:hypothetical protein